MTGILKRGGKKTTDAQRERSHEGGRDWSDLVFTSQEIPGTVGSHSSPGERH